MTKGSTCVPFFKDRMTGFHWLVERTHANPTILGSRELVKQLMQNPNMGGVALAYTPQLDSSEQRTLLSEAEPKPSKLMTQYEYDTYLDRLRLGGGKALVNTRGKASKQADSDKIAHEALQNFWKMAVADMNKRKSKNNVEAGANAEGSRERFLQPDDKLEDVTDDIDEETGSGDTKQGEPSVKVETDEAFFKRERKEKQSTPHTRPIRLKIPKSRFYDNGQPKACRWARSRKEQQFGVEVTLAEVNWGRGDPG